jgi:hypothetical protein
MADWLRPTLRGRARMAQPVVAQWRGPSGTRLSASPTVPVGRSCTQGARRYHSVVEVGRSSHWLRRSWRRCPAATAELSQQ